MSNWNSSDLEAEDYDPNKDYSVQVQRKDGGLASTQVRFPKIQSLNPYPLIFGTITERHFWNKNPKSSLVTSQLGLWK